ncbi:MAG: SipW-dependent-type signal peptide-containing protein [Propionibacteriales bacterium]|nr:SipW-dependent-type signal peptide-containing protein [Propionibacteriales bacterium]
MPSSTPARRALAPTRGRWRKVRALLAGGLVLGVGAAGTLAAWTDTEYAGSTFTSGTFGIVGATNGSTFSEHPAAPGATLTFAPTVGAMVPGSDSYGLFAVRTTSTSVAGTVTVSTAVSGASNALTTSLRFGVRTISGTTCNAAAYSAGTVVVADGSTLTSPPTASPQSLAAAGADQQNYCFKLSLPSNADNGAQGRSTTVQWTFAAQNS